MKLTKDYYHMSKLELEDNLEYIRRWIVWNMKTGEWHKAWFAMEVAYAINKHYQEIHSDPFALEVIEIFCRIDN